MIVLVRHECRSEEESGATQRARQSVHGQMSRQ